MSARGSRVHPLTGSKKFKLDRAILFGLRTEKYMLIHRGTQSWIKDTKRLHRAWVDP